MQEPEHKGPGGHGKELGFSLIATASFMWSSGSRVEAEFKQDHAGDRATLKRD